MKFSIIVPVYNAEKYLDRLIKSILDQTFEDFELILVDDGSTDRSFEIISEYMKNYTKIFGYSKKNEGPGLTRKFGFEKSSGDLIFFIDSDDWLPNMDVLNIINNTFNKNNFDILFFNRCVKSDIKEDKILKPFEKCHIDSGYHNIDEIQDYSIRGGLGLKVFKRNVIKKDFFPNAYNFEDFYTSYLALNEAKSFYYLKENLYNINREETNNKSLTSNYTFEKYDQAVCLLNKLYSNIENKSIKYAITHSAISIYTLYLKLVLKKVIKLNECKYIKEQIKLLKCNIIKYNGRKIINKFDIKYRLAFILMNLFM